MDHENSHRQTTTGENTYPEPPQGCVLSPNLFSPFTRDYALIHTSNSRIKSAQDTTVVGLISDNNEAAYRHEVKLKEGQQPRPQRLQDKGSDHQLQEDKSKRTSAFHVHGEAVRCEERIQFLTVNVSNQQRWTFNTSNLVKKLQHWLFFLRKLKKAQLPQRLTEPSIAFGLHLCGVC